MKRDISIWRILFYSSFLVYLGIIIFGVYNAINGYSLFSLTEETFGIEAFVDSICTEVFYFGVFHFGWIFTADLSLFMGVFLGFLFTIALIYQIFYYQFSISKKDFKFTKLLFTYATIPWIFYVISNILSYFLGALSIELNKTIYGMDAMLLSIKESFYNYIIVLGITFLYMFIYLAIKIIIKTHDFATKEKCINNSN